MFFQRIESRALVSDDKMQTNGRVIMSHIIKDDGLIAQRLVYALSLLLVIMKLSSLLHFYWLLQLKIQSSDARKYEQFPKCHY